MKGFDAGWRDLPDDIIAITSETRENRSIATLHPCYAPDIVVRSPARVSRAIRT